MNRPVRLSVLVALTFCASFYVPGLALAQPTVTTDYPDYYPGEYVVVTGAGWWPGETVSLTFNEEPFQHLPYVLTSVADSTGAFTNAQYLIEDHDLGTTFTLVAVGMSSDLTTQVIFTDSPKVGFVSVGAQSGTVCSTTGGTATYTVTVNRGSGGGSSGSFTANLTISGLPAGVGFGFGTTPLSFAPSDATKSTTLTLSTSGTPAGATSFSVRASTSASDFATGSGSLLVNQPPSISCPDPITVNSTTGLCGAVVTFEAVASGTPAPTVTYSINPGTVFAVGTTTVTATATNTCGSANCTFTVTVVDGERPTISAPSITTSTDSGLCTANVAPGATAADNCGVQSLVGSRSDGQSVGDPFPKGTSTITWTATDLHGNTATVTQQVTVNDTESPTITAPPSLSLNTGAGATECGLLIEDATLGNTTADDNCSFTVTRTGVPAGNFFPVGTTTITYTATDASGLSASATQAITVEDLTPPVIATTGIETPNDAGTCAAALALGTSATDNCGVASLTGIRGDGLPITDPFPVGTTTISWTATDIHGNTSTATQAVKVTDHEQPTITTANISVSTDPGLCSAVVTLGTTADDNCGVATLDGVRSDGGLLSAPYPDGTTTITWTATDVHGNTATATQLITVNDRENPTITAPEGLSLSTGAGATTCGLLIDDATLGNPTASDNCTFTVTRTGVPAGNVFPVGTTTVTYTATDASGNTAGATQTISVADLTPPLVTTADISVSTDPGLCSAAVATGTAATDNCAVATLVGNRGDGAPLDDPFPKGSTTIAWTATDIHGNIATAIQHVVVNDTEFPTLTPPAAVNASTGHAATTCGALVGDALLGNPIANDNCSFTVTRTGVPAGNLFPVGATSITYTVADPSGNSVSGIQIVTVTDDTPPTLTAPPSATASTGPTAAACGLVMTDAMLGTATGFDNCSYTLTRIGVPPANLFPIGATTITYTATDPSGNTTSQTQMITVLDGTPPHITTADLAVPTNPGLCSATIAALGTTAGDNCGPAPSLIGVRSDGEPLDSPFSKGSTTITWTATDRAGNSANATQTITVNNANPVVTLTGPSSGLVVSVGTPVTFTGTFTDDAGDVHTATWACDALGTAGVVNESTRTVSMTRTFSNAGVFLVTLNVTDQCGTSGTATQVGGIDAMIVVYDPSAGFVTGGGWIQSPAGAYVANPALTGKANFGFVSKYKKGQSTVSLTGETEFQFKAGALNFHSTSYEWLVISGAKAQYKGLGTINGTGSYGFLLSAVDGQISGGGGSDKFRIKITDKTTGETVYDNQLGASETDAATTALGGGSIAIHANGGQLAADMPAGAGEVSGSSTAPVANGLSQNQPNPFNPETAVHFTLARAGRVTLRVFDVRGSLVRTIVDETLEPGQHVARWNGATDRGGHVPSGVYYALLSTQDGYHNRIRMVLVK